MALSIPKRNPAQASQASAPVPGGGSRKPVPRGQVQAPAFIRATGEVKQRLIANIQGPEKTGKNHMAFGAPAPIYIHSFDLGLEGVVEKFQNVKEIQVAEYALEIQPGEATEKEVGEAANRVWEKFLSNFRDSIASTQAEGTVIVDTGTEAWELLRLASFGRLVQVMPHMYGKPNAEYRGMVRSSYDGTNVIWLHKMVDEWENFAGSDGKEKGRKTGRKVRKGFSDMAFLVQANVETWRNDLEGGGSEFGCNVIDCRVNPDINGTTWDNDFAQLLEMALAI